MGNKLDPASMLDQQQIKAAHFVLDFLDTMYAGKGSTARNDFLELTEEDKVEAFFCATAWLSDCLEAASKEEGVDTKTIWTDFVRTLLRMIQQ